jgi:hypothetical protein
VRSVKRELINAGIDEATIFPDLDGLGRAVGAEYAVEMNPWPHLDVVTRLQPSKAYPGEVGVFAISRIRKNTRPFRGENEEIVWLDRQSIATFAMSKSSRKLYTDFSLIRGERRGCPISFNRLTIAWYLKEEKPGFKANVRPDQYFEFYAVRDIDEGEELLTDFSPL